MTTKEKSVSCFLFYHLASKFLRNDFYYLSNIDDVEGCIKNLSLWRSLRGDDTFYFAVFFRHRILFLLDHCPSTNQMANVNYR